MLEHKPVMLRELVDFLDIIPDGTYVDCTGGFGGHATAVASALNEEGRLIVLDRDPEAVSKLEEIFKGDERVTVVCSNFSEIDSVLESLSMGAVDGIYADFGVSTHQLMSSERGFSIKNDGPLDMRMDKEGVSAADIINTYSAENIAEIIARYGEEPMARRIAKHIVGARAIKRIETTSCLAEIIRSAVPKKFHKAGIHPATRSFQAIRMYVNKELEAIQIFITKAQHLIKVGGVLVVISFHSLEDKLIKDTLNIGAKECLCPPVFPKCVCGKRKELKILSRKPATPSDREIKQNSKSRSAKMRAARRLV